MRRRSAAALMLGMPLLSRAGTSELVVGQVSPVADPASVGAQLARGAELFLSSANRNGGVFGRAIRLVKRHRSSDPADVLLQTQQLIEQAKPIALINMMGTGSMLTLVKAGVLEREAVPVIGVRTGEMSLRTPDNHWLFHVRADYGAEVERVLRHFETIGAHRVALIREASPFGVEVDRLFTESIRRTKLTEVARASVEPSARNAGRDIEPVLGAQPQGVLLALSSSAAAAFFVRLHAQAPAAQVIALSTAEREQVVREAGDGNSRCLGLVLVVPDPVTGTTRLVREFQRELSGSAIEGVGRTPATLEGFIAAMTLVEGLRRAGPSPTRHALKLALETMTDYDLGGYPLTFTPSNHAGSRFADIGIVDRNGKMLI